MSKTKRYRVYIKKCLRENGEMCSREIHTALMGHFKWEPTYTALNNILSKDREIEKLDKQKLVEGNGGRCYKNAVWKLRQ